MKILNTIILFTLTTLYGCFDSATQDASGGGLFSGHVEISDSYVMADPSAKIYKTAENIDIAITHPAVVTVTGTPRLTLTIGAATVYANYLSGSGSKTLVFRHTVTAGENDGDGIDVSSTIDLNGGNITFSNAGVITPTTTSIASMASTAAVKVDTSGPSITAVIPTTPKTYYEHEQLDFIITFDEITVVSGTPRIAMDVGGSTVYATYASGSNTTTHIYRYQVASTDMD